MDPQSIINALAAKGFLYNSGNDEVGPYFVMNGRAYTPEEAAAAIGVPASQVKQAAQASSFVPQLNQASQAAGTYPSSGGGFFSGLLNMVSDVGGGLSGAVANPVASALNVSPDLVRAAMLGAGALYGGGLLGGAEAGAAPAAAGATGAAPAATGAALGAEGLAVPATLGATAFPVAAAATPALASEAALGAYDASVGLTAGGANALAPTAVASGAGVANALSPEALAAYDASVGLTAGGVPATLSPEALAAHDASVGLTAGAGAGAGAGAAATGVGSVMSPGEGIDASIGQGMTEAGVGSGLTAPALASLAKFAKDYGIPLASLISGVTGAYTAKSAAQTQADAARYAADQAYKVFQEQKALQEPFRTAGIGAQNQLLTLLGLPGGTQGAEFGKYARPFSMQDFQADPGYAFRLSEGLKALEASRAAKSGLLSGSAMRAATRYGQEMGLQEYGNAFNRAQIERANRLAPLGSLASAGQAAATNMVGSAGQYGTNVGNLTTDIGATQAAGQLGAAKAVSNALGTYMNYLGNQDLANAIAQQRRQSQYSV